ncbi:MAG: polysaccharide biosynthesis/export protein, partial [Abditibacteriota bacterium]|nr:polysaccharide biosynthesis/export protein [Abditibacteriota bacterium]
ITLLQSRPQTISILGVVEKPGVYDLRPGWRVSDALAAAGGLTTRTEVTESTLGRAGQKSVWLDLGTILGDPSDSANQLLTGGDTLRFASRALQVSIAGQVKQPGVYSVAPGTSVLDVITQAGGANPTAALSQATIRRRNTPAPVAVDLLATVDPTQPDTVARVEDGDLIVIPESKSRISVLGAVQKPGTFNLEERSTIRLTEALALAGGLTVVPGASRIVITRNQADGQPGTRTIDSSALLERNDPTINEVVQDGDLISVVTVSRKVFISGEVKTPGAYDIKEGDSVPKIIALAGGTNDTAALKRIVVQRAGAAIPIDAYSALKQGSPLEFPLQDGDLVIVPKNTERVLVLGAVERPGPVAIEDNATLRVGEAVGLAGGAKDRAKLKEIGIFRNTPAGVERQILSLDKIYNGQPGLNHPLQSGDTLYVPEGKQSTSFWDQVGRALPILGLILR